jgi:hypothetical protein
MAGPGLTYLGRARARVGLKIVLRDGLLDLVLSGHLYSQQYICIFIDVVIKIYDQLPSF